MSKHVTLVIIFSSQMNLDKHYSILNVYLRIMINIMKHNMFLLKPLDSMVVAVNPTIYMKC